MATEDVTAIIVNNIITKNSFEVKNFLSGLKHATKKGESNTNILSIGTDVSLFTVQKRSIKTSKKLYMPINIQRQTFIDGECCCNEISCKRNLFIQ